VYAVEQWGTLAGRCRRGRPTVSMERSYLSVDHSTGLALLRLDKSRWLDPQVADPVPTPRRGHQGDATGHSDGSLADGCDRTRLGHRKPHKLPLQH
jgi:hypothetical protein